MLFKLKTREPDLVGMVPIPLPTRNPQIMIHVLMGMGKGKNTYGLPMSLKATAYKTMSAPRC